MGVSQLGYPNEICFHQMADIFRAFVKGEKLERNKNCSRHHREKLGTILSTYIGIN